MSNQQDDKHYEIGIIGLGIMGRNLALNMADHGVYVAGYDRDGVKVESLRGESQNNTVYCAENLDNFISHLKKPRSIMILVPAGKPVDAVIDDLLPYLEFGDLIIDAGNSHFTDTDRRAHHLQMNGIQFMGIGLSGGEQGARFGPSIMPGGHEYSYEQVRIIFDAIAAKVNGDPCVAYLGSGSVGHFVKMVHNGIEYGIMQLIAETYDLMKRALGLNNKQLHEVYDDWNKTELNSYLIDITSRIFLKQDEKTSNPLIDEILGIAKQNGTGKWTSQSSLDLQIPTPTIDIAVAMRDLSVLVTQREQAGVLYNPLIQGLPLDSNSVLKQLRGALYLGMIMTYAQGFALLLRASDHYVYHLNLESVAHIWLGGCIIRSALLDRFVTAFRFNPNLPNLLLDSTIAREVGLHQHDLRDVVGLGVASGIALPALTASLSYFDSYRSVWLPDNLIQAQRDYFGAHGFERIDSKGIFHADW